MITLYDFLDLLPDSQKFIVRICSFKNPGYLGLNYYIIKEFKFDNGFPNELPSDMNEYFDCYIDYVYSEINGYVQNDSYIFLLIFIDKLGGNM